MTAFLSALRVQRRVISALIYREAITKTGHNKAGILSALGAPLSQILILSLLFTIIGRNNPVGGSIVLFLATAIIPYNFCVIMATQIMTSSLQSKSLMTHTLITPFDSIIANLIIESAILLAAGTIIFLGVGYFGFWDYSYDSLIGIELVVITSITLGFSIGLMNAALASRFAFYPKIWSLLTRPLFFMSGIFYIASERFPPEILSILYFNPILHITEWSRSAFYRSWETSFVDFHYLYGFILSTLFVGLTSQRLMQEDTRE